jgi:hypothetical protein
LSRKITLLLTASKKNWWFIIGAIFMQLLLIIPIPLITFSSVVLIQTDYVPGLFLIGFSIFFISAYVWFWYVLVWFLWGKEIVRINENAITIKKKCAIRHLNKKYDLQHVKCISIAEEPYCDKFYSRFFDTTLAINTGGRIKFDYGMKTIRFGYLLESEDAEKLLKIVKQKLSTTE